MRSLLILFVLAAAACGSDSNSGNNSDGGSADLSATGSSPDMAILSRCGRPGDVGNSLGVGSFCTNVGPDCTANSMAKTCSALFNGQTPAATDTYFCTFQCQASDPPGTCGAGAECLCNATNICACIPTVCAPTDGGA